MPADVGIGTKLREAREERELSIEESAWRTRIKPETLRALEGDEFTVLGHEAFARSHLVSYARFLGIDAAAVARQFDRQTGPAPSAIEELERRDRRSEHPRRARWLIAAGISTLVLTAGGIVGVLGGQSERPSSPPLLQPPVDVSPSASATAAPVPAAEARVRLVVEVVTGTTMSVIADDAQVFEGALEEGEKRTFLARRSLVIFVADGAAVRLTHNGKELGAPGEPGTVFRGTYGARAKTSPNA